MRRGIVNKFNRGELDSRALLRDDVDKVINSCELLDNFMPLRLGPMQFRPGTRYISDIAGPSYLVPFIARTDDYALLSFQSDSLTVWVDDELVDSPTGTGTITNPDFATDLSGWTDASGAGSSVIWSAGGNAVFRGFSTSSAKLWQTMGGVGIGVEHSVRIVVLEAPLLIRIGEDGVDSDELYNGTLEPGTHSLTFTPVSNMPTITFSNSEKYRALLVECSVGDGNTLSLPLPSTVDDLTSIRQAHSADVLFVATSSTELFKVERRGKKSWSVVEYHTEGGPFGLINNTDITLASSGLEGNPTVTASEDLFRETDVGRLVKIASSAQIVRNTVADDDAGTLPIRVVGVAAVRKFHISITGTWVGSVTLQRSPDEKAWQDVESYGGNRDKVFYDDLDNSILFYRLWVESGDYTSGDITLHLNIDSGSVDGVARITQYIDPLNVQVQVLTPFGDFKDTRDWHMGEWGSKGVYPTSTSLYEGRLWWGGQAKVWGSVSDEYGSFDSSLEGDSAPIRRTIGFGPVDTVEWLAPSSRLIAGVASDEISIRSSSFGVVLSQSNCNLKSGSSQGVAPIEPLKVDDQLLFVQRSGVKIMDAGYVADADAHRVVDLMTLHPRICKEGIVRMAAARQPETRIYVVLADGTMRVHLQDPAEEVAAWSRITMDGLIKDIAVLPGFAEDQVYITIERNGQLQLEKFNRLDDVVNHHFDAAVNYIGPGTTLTGLDHLDGETVGVWADGQDRGDFGVVGGQVVVPEAWGTVIAGLRYVAQYKSNKLSSYMPQGGRVVGKLKRVVDFHLAMEDYWPAAITTGPDFLTLEPMPLVEFGSVLNPDQIVTDYDERPIEFNGEHEVDSRVCIQATGPCTILALSYGVLTEGDSEN